MASKLIKAAAFAAIALGLTISSIGFVSGIAPFVYAFFQGLTLKSAGLYLGASALFMAPWVITPVRQFLMSGLNILISRFSWRADNLVSWDRNHVVFTNKSPFSPRILDISMKRSNDGYYEITVTSANDHVYQSLSRTLMHNGFSHLIKFNGYNLKLKTNNQSFISNFLYHVSKEAPEVRGMVTKFKTKLEADFGFNTSTMRSVIAMPSWISQQKHKYGREVLTLISTSHYGNIYKMKLSSNRDVKLFHGGYLTLRTRRILNDANIHFIENHNHVLISNITQLQLALLSSAIIDENELTDKVYHFSHQYMRVNNGPQHPAGSENDLHHEEDEVDAFEYDDGDLSSEHLEKVKLTNEQRLEKINERCKSKGLPEIDVPENYLCAIGLGLMDDPVYDKRAPQRFDLSNITLSLDQKLENPFTRQPLYREELKHDRELQKEINDFLYGLEHPKPREKVAPPITPAAKRHKQTSRKKPEVEQNQPVEGVAARTKHKRQGRR